MEAIAAGIGAGILMAVLMLVHWLMRLWRPQTEWKTTVGLTVFVMFGVVFGAAALGLLD